MQVNIDNYTQAVDNLKQLLRQKRIKYKKIFKLINNCLPIEDIDVKKLADIVISKRELILINFETELDNLSLLNQRLIQFNKEPQLSKNKARKELAKICINIYDLLANRINKEVDYLSLKQDIKKHPDRKFSSKIAKKYINISCFLKKL